MKTMIPSMAFAVLCVSLTAFAGEKKAEIKWDMDYLDKSWGIKLKSANVNEQKNEVKMLLEFTKDVTDLREMRQAFQAPDNNAKLWFLFFDEENVAFAKTTITKEEGELTGKAGDAFRIYLSAPVSNPKAFSITKRVSARPSDNDKHTATKVSPKHFTNSIGMEFVWIPPGTFLMGSSKKEAKRCSNEAQHGVTLTKGFYMGVHLVTQEQWQEVMGNNPSHFKGETNLPVEMVSWEDCQEFCKELREKDNKQYRLPSEAEWEYACRAGTTTPFSFGDTISTDQANYDGNSTYGNGKKAVHRGKTTPVSSFPANAWGLHDMHGNVGEWCQDWLGVYPANIVVDPQGPKTGEKRILRGGCWNSYPEFLRSAFRFSDEPDSRSGYFGFRVCFNVK
jgi:formylglycine-generating enzyme